MSKIQRALLSVTDKSGVVEFARELAQGGVELISTGGTAKALREAGIAVKDISELTGFPEMLDGRVKTLHPKVHGGILHIRGNPEHLAAVREHGIQPIDMVVVNLYAFEKTAAKPGVRFEDVIENIDIGGPSMVRSAAKNFHDVAVVTAPGDYPGILAEMRANGGALSLGRAGGWRRRHFPPPRPMTRRLRQPWNRSRHPPQTAALTPASLPRTTICRQRCGSTFTRPSTCAMARILTRKRPSTATVRAKEWPTQSAPGQRAFLQQHSRPASGMGAGAGIRRAGLRHYQAHQPLRHRHRARPWRKPTGGRWSAIRFQLSAG